MQEGRGKKAYMGFRDMGLVNPRLKGFRHVPQGVPGCISAPAAQGFSLFLSFLLFFFFFKDFIYLFMRETEREAETQAEGEAGSMQGARCGTQSRVMP